MLVNIVYKLLWVLSDSLIPGDRGRLPGGSLMQIPNSQSAILITAAFGDKSFTTHKGLTAFTSSV